MTYPFGAYICVMEIDVDTGMSEIKQFYALDDLLARHRLQQSVEAHAFRSGRLLTVELPITVSPADTAYLTIGDAERVEKWLGLTEPVGVA